MALYRWPTDPPGKAPAHTKTWEQHNQPASAGTVGIGGKALAPGAWERGDFLKALLQGSTPAPAAPAAAAAAPAAAPQSALPLIEPPDPIFTEETEALGKTYRSDLIGNTEGRKRGLTDYGFLEDETTGGLTFDANNPFSRAALLKKNYDTQRARSRQTMGAGGQLYSGAFQNQQDLVNRGQLGDEDTLQKALGEFLLSNTDQKRKIGENYALGLRGANEARVGRINTNPLYSPTTSAEDAAAVAPPAGSVGKPASATTTKKASTIKAGPGVKATKNTTVSKKKSGKTVTYSTSIKGP